MPFVKGKSGNPAGRAKGVPDRRTKLRALLEPHVPELFARVLEAALAGDMVAMRLCLERVCPTLKPITQAEAIKVDLTGTPVEQSREVLMAISNGALTIEEATQLLAGIASSMKILEISELEKRLEALEEAATQGSQR